MSALGGNSQTTFYQPIKAASKLARGDDMPLMVIESEETVYYLNPCDSAKMSAARGDFTVPEDAHKVNSILDKMLDADHAHAQQRSPRVQK